MKTFWKSVMYILLSLAIVIVGVLVVVAIKFSRLSFRDSFDATTDYSAFYPSSYQEAREDFRTTAKTLSDAYEGVQQIEFKVPSSADADLTVMICYIPARERNSNLLVISSGVHGVEGYVGHAAQMLFVDKFLNPDLLAQTGVLLIHSLNPYGFKYTRRVTESNVDLNRNSPSTYNLYSTVNEGYTKVYDLINPRGSVRRGSLENRLFFLKAINEIRKASLPVLRQAVLQGQYQFPQGLYFGGTKPEPQIDSLGPVLARITLPYRRIKTIDLHTGYGERGRLHLFPNPVPDSVRVRMENLYEGFHIDWGDSDDFYTITGDFVGFVGSVAQGKEHYPMVFEYGTLNSQTTMGSLKSIHIMILENQGHQYGFASARDSIGVKADLLEMYFPQSEGWRNHVMQQTEEMLGVVIPRFADGNY